MGRKPHRVVVGKPEKPRRILEKEEGVMWIGFAWLRIEMRGGFLRTWQCNFGFHKILGNFGVVERQAAS
jgi:hypothetical protein